MTGNFLCARSIGARTAESGWEERELPSVRKTSGEARFCNTKKLTSTNGFKALPLLFQNNIP